MTTDRIKKIQAETAYPNSTSVQQALLKVWNECEQEQKQVKNCSIPFVGLSLPDEDEINSMRLEIDCPTPNEEEYTKAGFKSGVRWLKNTIERQLQGQ